MNVTPKDIYDVYPGSDLLALFPPEENETFAAYKKRMGGREGILDCGDTLFAFLLFEAEDAALDHKEVMRRFTVARNDIDLVLEAFTIKYDPREDQ